MIKKLDKYIIKAFIGPLIITFFICVFLLLMQFLWKYIDDLVGKGLDWDIILELLFYASLGIVPMAVPLAVLLSTIMTFGAFGEKNELFAMKSGGISLYRIMYPLFFVSILIFAASFYFQNNILPYTNLKMRSLLYSIQEQRPELSIREGVFTEAVDELSIKVDYKQRKKGVLEGVLVYDKRGNVRVPSVTTAKTGSVKITDDKTCMILELNEGYRYEELGGNHGNSDSHSFQKSKFREQIVYLELDGLGLNRNNEDLFKSGYEMLNVKQLKFAIDSINYVISDKKDNVWEILDSYSLFRAKNDWVMASDEDDLLSKEIRSAKENHRMKDSTFLDVSLILNELDDHNRLKVLELALNYARSAESYIEYNDEDLLNYNRYVARHIIEWHRKITLSLACVLFFIFGAPLGAVIRKGGFGLPVILSVVIFLLYYVISITFEKMSREIVLEPNFGMWISTLVLAPLAFFFTYKAANDTMRISPYLYLRVKKLFIKKRKSKSAEK